MFNFLTFNKFNEFQQNFKLWLEFFFSLSWYKTGPLLTYAPEKALYKMAEQFKSLETFLFEIIDEWRYKFS